MNIITTRNDFRRIAEEEIGQYDLACYTVDGDTLIDAATTAMQAARPNGWRYGDEMFELGDDFFEHALKSFERKFVAAQLGAKGGKSKSARKTAAVRENGKKGGRPKTERVRWQGGTWIWLQDSGNALIEVPLPYYVQTQEQVRAHIAKQTGERRRISWGK